MEDRMLSPVPLDCHQDFYQENHHHPSPFPPSGHNSSPRAKVVHSMHSLCSNTTSRDVHASRYICSSNGGSPRDSGFTNSFLSCNHQLLSESITSLDCPLYCTPSCPKRWIRGQERRCSCNQAFPDQGPAGKDDCNDQHCPVGGQGVNGVLFRLNMAPMRSSTCSACDMSCGVSFPNGDSPQDIPMQSFKDAHNVHNESLRYVDDCSDRLSFESDTVRQESYVNDVFAKGDKTYFIEDQKRMMGIGLSEVLGSNMQKYDYHSSVDSLHALRNNGCTVFCTDSYSRSFDDTTDANDIHRTDNPFQGKRMDTTDRSPSGAYRDSFTIYASSAEESHEDTDSDANESNSGDQEFADNEYNSRNLKHGMELEHTPRDKNEDIFLISQHRHSTEWSSMIPEMVPRWMRNESCEHDVSLTGENQGTELVSELAKEATSSSNYGTRHASRCGTRSTSFSGTRSTSSYSTSPRLRKRLASFSGTRSTSPYGSRSSLCDPRLIPSTRLTSPFGTRSPFEFIPTSPTGIRPSSLFGTRPKSPCGTKSTSPYSLGSKSASGTGLTSSSGTGLTSSSGIGSTSPSGIGSTSPSGIGSTSPSGIGSTSPSGTGSTSPSDTGSTSPSGIGSTSPSGTGSTSSSGTGSTSSSGTGSTSPSGIGSTSSSDIGSTSSSGIGLTSPSGTGSTSPNGTSQKSPFPGTDNGNQDWQSSSSDSDCGEEEEDEGRWIGRLLASQASSVILSKIFSFLPALDLLVARQVCKFWQQEVDVSLKTREQMTWHTSHNHCRDVMWNDVVRFLRGLRFQASHLLLFASRKAWSPNGRNPASSFPSDGDVIRELSRHLPVDCVISGGVALNGLIGTSTDLESTQAYNSTDPAVTMLAVGKHADVSLSPAGIVDGQLRVLSRPSPQVDEHPGPGEKMEGEGEEEEGDQILCLSTTPAGIDGYLRAENPHPTFFLGLRPAVQGFTFMDQSFETRFLQSLQCVLLRGPRQDQTYLSISSISHDTNLQHVLTNYSSVAGRLRQDGCRLQVALQLVTYSIYNSRSYFRFRRLLRGCCTHFRTCFPEVPVLGVMVRASDSQRRLAQRLLFKSQSSIVQRYKAAKGLGVQQDTVGDTANHSDITGDVSSVDSSVDSTALDDVNVFEKRLDRLAEDFNTGDTTFDPSYDPHWDVVDVQGDYSEDEEDLEDQLYYHDFMDWSYEEDVHSGEDGDAEEEENLQQDCTESEPTFPESGDHPLEVLPQQSAQKGERGRLSGKTCLIEGGSGSETPQETTPVRFDRAVRYHKESKSAEREISLRKASLERNDLTGEDMDFQTPLDSLSSTENINIAEISAHSQYEESDSKAIASTSGSVSEQNDSRKAASNSHQVPAFPRLQADAGSTGLPTVEEDPTDSLSHQTVNQEDTDPRAVSNNVYSLSLPELSDRMGDPEFKSGVSDHLHLSSEDQGVWISMGNASDHLSSFSSSAEAWSIEDMDDSDLFYNDWRDHVEEEMEEDEKDDCRFDIITLLVYKSRN